MKTCRYSTTRRMQPIKASYNPPTARDYLIDLMDNGIVSCADVALECIKQMSEDDVCGVLEAFDMLDDYVDMLES